MQTELRELKGIDSKIRDNVIMPVFESVSSEYNMEKSVIVVRIIGKGEKYEVRASVVYRDDFNWYLFGKKDKLFGFTEYNGILVLIFGNSADKFFIQTNTKENFPFLNTEGYRENIEHPEIEIEPDMFEPVVWVYLVRNGKYALIEKSAFPLLE